jgi:hypothetical protein
MSPADQERETALEIELRGGETEAGWQGTCDRFGLSAAPTWFSWLEWVFVLGAVDYLAAKTGAWLPRVVAAVSIGLLWTYFNAFFFRVQFKGWFGVRSPRVERALSTLVSSLLAGFFWFAAQAIATAIVANTK